MTKNNFYESIYSSVGASDHCRSRARHGVDFVATQAPHSVFHASRTATAMGECDDAAGSPSAYSRCGERPRSRARGVRIQWLIRRETESVGAAVLKRAGDLG